jgi:protoporphyrinogen oxidase
MDTNRQRAIIIGAGPAGLTAGFELLKTQRFHITILEKESEIGGLAKTVDYKGYKFDIGPHHYITESKEIEEWWKNIAKDEFIKLKRFTRIFYNKHFFLYPLEPINALFGLNIFESMRCVFSYFRYKLFPKKVTSYEDWLTNRFGKRLFEIFFKSYTEKLWGVKCTEISADWAAQRIKNFSLGKAMFFAFFGKFFKKHTPRTILSEFYYPIHGSGSLWNKVGQEITGIQHCPIYTQETVISIEHKDGKITAVLTKNASTPEGTAQKLTRHEGDYFLSSMTLRDLVLQMDPVAPEEILQAAKQLRCRALVTINLIINQEPVTTDHWLYVHEKSVRTIRIGNMNNFSAKLRPVQNHTALSLECFTFTDEPFWFKSDTELLEQAKFEIDRLGLVTKDLILDGMVLKIPDAYPIYEGDYKKHLNLVYNYLAQFKNLKLMGRNGMHQYNNMDTAMLSAIKAVDEIIKGHVNQTKKVAKRSRPKQPALRQAQGERI